MAIGAGGKGFTTATTATVGGHHAVRLRLPHHQPGGGGGGLLSRVSTRAKAGGPPGGVDGSGVQGPSSLNDNSAAQDPPLTPGGIKSVDHPKSEKPDVGGAMRQDVIPLPVARGLLLMVKNIVFVFLCFFYPELPPTKPYAHGVARPISRGFIINQLRPRRCPEC